MQGSYRTLHNDCSAKLSASLHEKPFGLRPWSLRPRTALLLRSSKAVLVPSSIFRRKAHAFLRKSNKHLRPKPQVFLHEKASPFRAKEHFQVLPAGAPESATGRSHSSFAAVLTPCTVCSANRAKEHRWCCFAAAPPVRRRTGALSRERAPVLLSTIPAALSRELQESCRRAAKLRFAASRRKGLSLEREPFAPPARF